MNSTTQIKRVSNPSFKSEITIGPEKGCTQEIIDKNEIIKTIKYYQKKLLKQQDIYLSAKITELVIVMGGQVQSHLTVSFINYPKFQLPVEALKHLIEQLSIELMNIFEQNRIAIAHSDETIMFDKENAVAPRIKNSINYHNIPENYLFKEIPFSNHKFFYKNNLANQELLSIINNIQSKAFKYLKYLPKPIHLDPKIYDLVDEDEFCEIDIRIPILIVAQHGIFPGKSQYHDKPAKDFRKLEGLKRQIVGLIGRPYVSNRERKGLIFVTVDNDLINHLKINAQYFNLSWWNFTN